MGFVTSYFSVNFLPSYNAVLTFEFADEILQYDALGIGGFRRPTILRAVIPREESARHQCFDFDLY